MSEETVDLVALMNMRAQNVRPAGKLVPRGVDADSLRELQAHALPHRYGQREGGRRVPSAVRLSETAWDDSVTELAIDFVRTFIGHGVNAYSAAYPYESVYTSERRLMMQEARAEVLQTLRENG